MSKRKGSDRQRRRRQELKREKRQGRGRTQASESFPRPAKQPSGATPAPPIPPMSFASMERTMRELHQALESQHFESGDDLHAFVEQFNRRGGQPGAPGRMSPADEAQDIAYQAMEASDAQTAVKLAMQAVDLDPNCVDALIILAQAGSRSPDDLIENMRMAVDVGERALGDDYFEEHRGHFWGLLETRPYMRARQELADLLREAGRTDEAVEHYEQMLDLNPNDNQGLRDLLLACYLLGRNLAGAERLFQQFDGDASATFQWARVLEKHLADDGDGAVATLRSARKDNPFVEDYLTGKKRPPRNLPGYYSPGEESEAQYVAINLRPVWKKHGSAVAWLKAQA